MRRTMVAINQDARHGVGSPPRYVFLLGTVSCQHGPLIHPQEETPQVHCCRGAIRRLVLLQAHGNLISTQRETPGRSSTTPCEQWNPISTGVPWMIELDCYYRLIAGWAKGGSHLRCKSSCRAEQRGGFKEMRGKRPGARVPSWPVGIQLWDWVKTLPIGWHLGRSV